MLITIFLLARFPRMINTRFMRSPLYLDSPARSPDLEFRPRRVFFYRFLLAVFGSGCVVSLCAAVALDIAALDDFVPVILLYVLPMLWHEPLHYVFYLFMGVPARFSCVRTWMPKYAATYPAVIAVSAAAPLIASLALCVGGALFMSASPLWAVNVLFYVTLIHASDWVVIRRCVDPLLMRSIVGDYGDRFSIWLAL